MFASVPRAKGSSSGKSGSQRAAGLGGRGVVHGEGERPRAVGQGGRIEAERAECVPTHAAIAVAKREEDLVLAVVEEAQLPSCDRACGEDEIV